MMVKAKHQASRYKTCKSILRLKIKRCGHVSASSQSICFNLVFIYFACLEIVDKLFKKKKKRKKSKTLESEKCMGIRLKTDNNSTRPKVWHILSTMGHIFSSRFCLARGLRRVGDGIWLPRPY